MNHLPIYSSRGKILFPGRSFDNKATLSAAVFLLPARILENFRVRLVHKSNIIFPDDESQ